MRTRRYETVILLPGDLEEGKVQEILEKLEGVIDKSGGVLVKKDDWGLRKLAYEIKRSTKGRYFLLDIAGPADLIMELERHIKIMESILRFLTIKKEDVADMEEMKKEQAEEKEKEAAKKAAALEREALEKEKALSEAPAAAPEAEEEAEGYNDMPEAADDVPLAEETGLPEAEEMPEDQGTSVDEETPEAEEIAEEIEEIKE